MKFGFNRDLDKNKSHAALLGCIDRGLDTFGTNVKRVVYWKMEQELGLRREEIPVKPGLFAGFIEIMFGVGSVAVESAMIREMKLVSGVGNFPTENLADAIAQMHKIFEKEQGGRVK